MAESVVTTTAATYGIKIIILESVIVSKLNSYKRDFIPNIIATKLFNLFEEKIGVDLFEEEIGADDDGFNHCYMILGGMTLSEAQKDFDVNYKNGSSSDFFKIEVSFTKESDDAEEELLITMKFDKQADEKLVIPMKCITLIKDCLAKLPSMIAKNDTQGTMHALTNTQQPTIKDYDEECLLDSLGPLGPIRVQNCVSLEDVKVAISRQVLLKIDAKDTQKICDNITSLSKEEVEELTIQQIIEAKQQPTVEMENGVM